MYHRNLDREQVLRLMADLEICSQLRSAVLLQQIEQPLDSRPSLSVRSTPGSGEDAARDEGTHPARLLWQG
ncbi:MAG: hypothetical protein DWQ34_09525 [Planctomycetota bacterium]|nr:MAG: hypothetical protein DWQ34_09525 [Planctomycetota bacterium]REJ95860.1 MAG: hypothetical protein DWQ29_01465 [Planctomycetota bacterium]REK20695.1 MAG: hypothetical protein DWQ41_23900 [Planctomycetota bacterium]REK38123.1 MAG: hypothetical protein DWQ45_05650 [Planctomycetota bacterium]